MNTLMKSAGGITQVSADSRLLAKRIMFLEGMIDANRAGEFARQILVLNQESMDKPIRVLINSMGGEISAGMMIYDVIQGSKAPVETYCVGVPTVWQRLLWPAAAMDAIFCLMGN